MSDPRSYVASMTEDSLGLVEGSLTPQNLPEDLVASVASAVRGHSPGDSGVPFLEKQMISLNEAMRATAIKDDGYFVRKARWPGAAPFAVCLTHDVDNITRSRGHVWKTRSRFALPDLIKGLLGFGHIYDNVEMIASREGAYGFHSSFYFLSSHYPLADVKRESDRVRAPGWEVGLHGDFGTHDSQEKMDLAISRFWKGMGFRPAGLREHFLKFDFSKSWAIMEKAGFDYDSSVGSTNHLGFRIGLAAPFHPPDESWSPMKILELPLSLMDTTIWGYLKRGEEDGFSDSMKLMKAVEDVEGLFTLLWHQEAVRMKGGRTYWRLLGEVMRSGCFTGSGEEVSRWWRARSVPLLKKGNSIRLGGPPPRDLVLRLSLAEGRTPRVTSGTIEQSGNEYLVKPKDAGFTLEVD
jgi:hypothetical protein